MAKRLRKNERQKIILAELRATPMVRALSLAEQFGVSTETIRRDLDELSAQGKVLRTYGGVATRSLAHEPEVHEREVELVEERARIGEAATNLVSPGDVLMIDAGSTTTHFARRLAACNPHVTVITNRPVIAEILSRAPAIRAILCPGDYSAEEGAVFGAETNNFLRRFNATTSFIGAGGLTTEGVTDVDSGGSWVKRTMINRAERVVLLVDHSKFNQPLLEVVCGLDAINEMVVDVFPNEGLRAALSRAGVSLTIA